MRYHSIYWAFFITSSSFAQWQEGVGTHFQALGQPYGGCGVPDAILTQEGASAYVALNAFHSPGDYRSAGSFGKRPLQGQDTVWRGAYEDGRNCGRWIEIELGDDCLVPNGGAKGETVCGNETGWVSDDRNGAVLYAVVADECTDDNVWCRDVAGHLDIHTPALNEFRMPNGDGIAPYAFLQDGQWVTSDWNNRKLRWRFVEAPQKGQDVQIFYTEGSQDYWQRILITRLPNGIHGVEQKVGDEWIPATMGAAMGQMWILPRPDLPEPHWIRIRDVQDSLIFGGRLYAIRRPAECGETCSDAAHPALVEAMGGIDPRQVRISKARNQRIDSVERWRWVDLLGRIRRE